MRPSRRVLLSLCLVSYVLCLCWSREASAKNLWEERRRQGPYGVAPSAVALPPALTPLEARYDADGDGRLSDAEGRAYLRERAAILRTEGRVAVHTELERAYDADGDGVISGSEAAALLADLAESFNKEK